MKQSRKTQAETYLDRLLAGDTAAVRAVFQGPPTIDDPPGGRVRLPAGLEKFVSERHTWLFERGARLSPLRTTTDLQRTIFEAVIDLRLVDRTTELPVAVVSDNLADGRVRAIRVYHSLWPIFGSHRVRQPLLKADPKVHITDVVAEYQHALATGDAAAIVNTFEQDGYFREPAGNEHVYQGHTSLMEFMTRLLGTGGIGLEHCTATDDGVACVIEFNAVRFGKVPIVPQAGAAVY
jgi:hypothetical protein